MIEYSELSFRKTKLYWGKQNTGFSVWEDKIFSTPTFKAFRVKWPDGILSADYYNLSRAKDRCRKIFQNVENKRLESLKNNAEVDSQTGSTSI